MQINKARTDHSIARVYLPRRCQGRLADSHDFAVADTD